MAKPGCHPDRPYRARGLCSLCYEHSPERREGVLQANARQYYKRRQIVNGLKSRPCADCGIQYPPCVMDFDHTKGTKRFNVSRLSHRMVDVVAEIEKCDVVCANCHRMRTYARGHK